MMNCYFHTFNINLTVHITLEIIEKGTFAISLEEDLYVLDEVKISNIALTGNLNTDIAQTQIVWNMPVNLNFRDIKNMRFASDVNDPKSAPLNLALGQRSGAAPGVDVLGVFFDLIILNIIGSRDRVAPKFELNGEITSELRKLFLDDFFTESLQVEKDSIDDFIYYVDDNGLRDILGKPDYQLALIEFLIEQGKIYNAIKLD